MKPLTPKQQEVVSKDFRRREFLAWAVDENYRDVDGTKFLGYIGIHWPLPDDLTKESFSFGGRGIRLFRSRSQARRAQGIIRRSYPKVRVNRVRLILEPVE